MKFSEAWLREWVNPDISTEELADQLSMAGLEVDSVEPVAPVFSGVVVGEVLSREPHPDADKLSVCKVDVAGPDQLQIVCGAKNVAAGMKVPVATVGGVLPGDFKIKKAKLRGVQSLGMICSASELGLADSSDGIMPLPVDAPVGDDFRAYLALDDHSIDVDLTPDRGDCLSVAGIAREVAVINREQLTPPAISPVPAVIDDAVNVQIQVPESCPRYSCRVIRNINAGAETPQWMVEKLRRSGIRAINPVVDVTNFVLLELGQPMHGFDMSKLTGDIQVRQSNTGEKLALLDGTEVDVVPETLLIADDNGPLALAGIMGGVVSSVTAETQDILLEAAFFTPTAIIGKARAYGLHTDSSHRFERGVDPDLQDRAIERATQLLQQISGGEAGPVVQVCMDECLPISSPIFLRRDRIVRLLGVSVSDETVEDILTRLGMTVIPVDEGWDVVAPGARFDISIEADLIEEIGRIYGYANIPENLSTAPVSINSVPEASFRLNRTKQMLVDRDYQEAITYSFISPKMAGLFTPDEKHIRLANPISADMSIMRASLWPGLVSTLMHNLARQQERVRLFESGLIFSQGEKIQQRPMLAGLIFGPLQPEQWGSGAKKVDFYDIKADVEAILATVDNLHSFQFEPTENPALHPGQAARVLRNGVEAGLIGMLHPALQAELDLSGNVFLFQLSLESLENARLPAFEPLSKYPAIRRDLAITVPRELSFSAVKECASRAAGEIVRDIRVFDVYTGDNIDLDLKSLALSLILQDYSSTLTDQDVDKASTEILQALASELSAKLRE